MSTGETLGTLGKRGGSAEWSKIRIPESAVLLRSDEKRSDKKNVLDQLHEKGLPTLRNEEWKYTDLSGISGLNLTAVSKKGPGLAIDELKHKIKPLFDDCLVFVNGNFESSLSRVATQDGVEIVSLREILEDPAFKLSEISAGFERLDRSGFADLNQLLYQDGSFIRIREDRTDRVPVHLIYLNTAGADPLVQYPRNLILLEKNTRLTLYEEYIGGSSAGGLSNTVTEIRLTSGAQLERIVCQQEDEAGFHVNSSFIVQESDSRLSSYFMTLGAGVSRNEIRVEMNGAGSTCDLYGVSLIRGKQHGDNFALIEHNAPDCQSSEQFNAILTGKSRAVFTGKVLVEREAQRTESKQNSRSLMLSENAHIDAKPQLEIYADDVQCAHSATVGQIDSDALFYLRSRGIETSDAELMLAAGFSGDISGEIRDSDIRKRLEHILENRLQELFKENR